MNIFASVEGNTEIAIGNILGSNITNILLSLGISSIIYPITAKRNTVIKEIPFSLFAALLLGIMANDLLIDGKGFSEITRIDGLVFLMFFALFIYYTFSITKSQDDITESEVKSYSNLKSVLFIILGLIGLVVGGKLNGLSMEQLS